MNMETRCACGHLYYWHDPRGKCCVPTVPGCECVAFAPETDAERAARAQLKEKT